jgi:hypothetical protein
MTDALLMVLVVGAVVLALGVDIAAVVGWVRRRVAMIRPAAQRRS